MNLRSNALWLSDLSDPGERREIALADLRQMVLTRLPYALNQVNTRDDPRFVHFFEEIAQDTLLRVLDRLPTFEGRSQFVTWVMKIAVRLAFSELRRRQWQEVSLDSLLQPAERPDSTRFAVDPAPHPEEVVEQDDLMARIMHIIQQELTPRQRDALTAAGFHGMPLEEVARRMDMDRNALYKLLHDARLRLKQRLAQEGLTSADVLATFSGK
jgi:RNA polymerase sigma-70 factor (ECF subfamily)